MNSTSMKQKILISFLVLGVLFAIIIIGIGIVDNYARKTKPPIYVVSSSNSTVNLVDLPFIADKINIINIERSGAVNEYTYKLYNKNDIYLKIDTSNTIFSIDPNTAALPLNNTIQIPNTSLKLISKKVTYEIYRIKDITANGSVQLVFKTPESTEANSFRESLKVGKFENIQMSYEFGSVPLIGDVEKLDSIVDSIEF